MPSWDKLQSKYKCPGLCPLHHTPLYFNHTHTHTPPVTFREYETQRDILGDNSNGSMCQCLYVGHSVSVCEVCRDHKLGQFLLRVCASCQHNVPAPDVFADLCKHYLLG